MTMRFERMILVRCARICSQHHYTTYIAKWQQCGVINDADGPQVICGGVLCMPKLGWRQSFFDLKAGTSEDTTNSPSFPTPLGGRGIAMWSQKRQLRRSGCL